MGLFFRNKVLFRAEKEMPDPEDLKLRFRRRVVLLTGFGAVCLLSIPVFRDQIPALESHKELRKFTEVLLQSHLLAEQTRSPVVLTLLKNGKTQEWEREIRVAAEDCSVVAAAPVEKIATALGEWHITYLPENPAPGVSVMEMQSICLHPRHGIFVNNKLVKQGLVQVLLRPEEDSSSARLDRMQKISLHNEGSEINLEPSGS